MPAEPVPVAWTSLNFAEPWASACTTTVPLLFTVAPLTLTLLTG